MNRYVRMAAAVFLMTFSIGAATGCQFMKDPWEGTWWGVQDAGMNWSGDNIRNLEIFTFTKEGDTISVVHQVQRGGKEIAGDLSGTGKVDGGRLDITPAGGGKAVTFTYSRTSNTIETTMTNSDKSPVTLKQLTDENKGEMEQIRKEIIAVSQKPENAINTTVSQKRKAGY